MQLLSVHDATPENEAKIMVTRLEEPIVKLRTLLLFSVLMLMTPVYLGPLIPTRPQMDKGLMIGAEYVFGMVSGAPSFSDLKSAGFNLVGTIAYGSWSPNWEWVKVKPWIQTAHAAGLKTFIDLYGNAKNVTSVAEFTRLAVSTGTDVVALDEVISTFNMTQLQLKSVIEVGREANPELQFIVNEWSPDYIRRAYEWTAGYSYVRVATDNYWDKSIIDLGIRLGQEYGKKPIVWLIFVKGSLDFDCYKNLNDWIAYVEQRQVSALLWYLDASGTWRAQWSKISAFDPLAYV